ncbi:hypothetical protein CYMTET_29996 [Cymbomonas tetramitiformis]|uniref:Uncharacterized protein n=1 Tax=Cymbomonas tetramitiformis TaxID=36881 RepID=A0AAE0FJX0_9CHLO|nr:hypothetical protein CYMTET_29996 [Cymbomonas tetramitiformis]
MFFARFKPPIQRPIAEVYYHLMIDIFHGAKLLFSVTRPLADLFCEETCCFTTPITDCTHLQCPIRTSFGSESSQTTWRWPAVDMSEPLRASCLVLRNSDHALLKLVNAYPICNKPLYGKSKDCKTWCRSNCDRLLPVGIVADDFGEEWCCEAVPWLEPSEMWYLSFSNETHLAPLGGHEALLAQHFHFVLDMFLIENNTPGSSSEEFTEFIAKAASLSVSHAHGANIGLAELLDNLSL